MVAIFAFSIQLLVCASFAGLFTITGHLQHLFVSGMAAGAGLSTIIITVAGK